MNVTLKVSALAVAVALLAAAPVSAASINIGGNGPLLGLGGTSSDPTATVAGSGNGGVLGGNGLLGLGGSDPAGNASTNLLDNNGGPTTADVTLGNAPGAGSTTGHVQLDLFGNAGGHDADVVLGTGGTGTTDVALDLFGSSGAGSGGGSGTGGNGGTGSGSGGNGGAGGVGGNGGNGGSGGPIDIFGNGGTGHRVASIGTGKACLTPDLQQTAKLVGRHQYTMQGAAGWSGVTEIRIVDAGLCNGVGASLATEPNIARLQDIVGKSPAIRASLSQQGHAAGDVIAVDRSGNALLVYVG